MKKSKIFAVVLSIVMTFAMFAVVGCDDKEEEPTPATQYTVVFKDGDTEVKKVTVNAGAVLTAEDVPAGPTKEGQTFVGWFNSETEIKAGVAINADTTATAKYKTDSQGSGEEEKTTYTVTYASGATDATGTAPTQAAVEEGGTFTVAANTFEYPVHVFDGWSDGTDVYAEGATYTVGTQNVTLTAQWLEGYAVYFVAGAEDVEGTMPTRGVAKAGEKYKTPSSNTFEFSREGYKFGYWVPSYDNAVKIYSGGQITMPEEDVTLTAHWNRVFKITYQIEGDDVTGDVPAATDVTQGSYRRPAQGGNLAKPGHVFAGWKEKLPEGGYSEDVYSYDGGEDAAYVCQDRDAILVPYWVAAHTVHYELGASDATGTVPADAQVGATMSYTVSAGSNLARTGYIFDGWTYNGQTYKPTNTFEMPDADVTFTAKWLKTHTVTYASGASDAIGDAPTQDPVGEGKNFFVKKNTFVREGYKFVGWNDGTADYQYNDSYTMGTADVTLTAQWEVVLKITYDGGDANATNETVVTEGANGETVIVANCTYLLAGHEFVAWKDSSDKVYHPGDEIEITANMTLTATWKEATAKLTTDTVYSSTKKEYVSGQGMIDVTTTFKVLDDYKLEFKSKCNGVDYTWHFGYSLGENNEITVINVKEEGCGVLRVQHGVVNDNILALSFYVKNQYNAAGMVTDIIFEKDGITKDEVVYDAWNMDYENSVRLYAYSDNTVVVKYGEGLDTYFVFGTKVSYDAESKVFTYTLGEQQKAAKLDSMYGATVFVEKDKFANTYTVESLTIVLDGFGGGTIGETAIEYIVCGDDKILIIDDVSGDAYIASISGTTMTLNSNVARYTCEDDYPMFLYLIYGGDTLIAFQENGETGGIESVVFTKTAENTFVNEGDWVTYTAMVGDNKITVQSENSWSTNEEDYVIAG